MMTWVCRNPVSVAATVGFIVPAYWVALGLLLFNLPSEVPLLDIAERVTYPPRMWDHSWPPLAGPVFNAGLYAAVGAALRMAGGRSVAVHREQPVVDVGSNSRGSAERELRWAGASVVAGLFGTILMEPPRPGVSSLETVGGVVGFGPVLGIFVYIFILLARLVTWSVTTGKVPDSGIGEDEEA